MGLYTYDDNLILRRIIRGVVYFVTLISFAWFIVYGLMSQTIISGQSMAPTLNSEDVCLVNRLAYDVGSPKRFDIILFERADTGRENVKRVIGLPGETILIADGQVYVDGVAMDSIYTKGVSLGGVASSVVELADDEFFVLGDNSASSEDSRFVNVGNVKRENIKGKLWLKMMPFAELSFIQ